MYRALILVLAALLSCACFRTTASRSTSMPSSSPQPASADGGGSDASYAAAAAKVTDACTVMPTALAEKIVPGGAAPVSEKFPLRCSVSNGTSVLEITIETGMITPTDPITGAEFISGLAQGGYLERLDPVARGDTYLTVILGKDPNGLLHVEVAGHDGKDHKDDAIAVAREVLTRFQ